MLKQKWLWGVIVLLLIISSSGLINRWKAEVKSDQYEIIIPYEEIKTVENESDFTLDEILSSLKEAGLTRISLEPTTFTSLGDQNIVAIFTEGELAAQLRFTSYRDTVDVDNRGYYISVPAEEQYRTLIEKNIGLEKVFIADEYFYFLPSSNEDYDLKTPIGYDLIAIEKLKEYGFNYTFRIANATSELANEHIVQELVNLNPDQTAGLLSIGEESFGFGYEPRNDWITQLVDAGYYYYTIEGNPVKGEQSIGSLMDFNIIRLHSMDANKEKTLTLTKSIDRTTRAIKERNIKSIFYHIKTTGNMEENLDEAISYLTTVTEKVPTQYTLGVPKVFDKISVPLWVTALTLLAGIIFTYIASELLKFNALRIAATSFMAIIAVGYLILDKLVLLQGFALLIAAITPAYAVIKSAKPSNRVVDMLLQYAKAIGISIVGIVIVIGLLNGNSFLVGYTAFRGVKLVYIIPILSIILFALFKLSGACENGVKTLFSQVVMLGNQSVRYWHLVVLLVVAAIGLFYISRTGNSGTASSFELMFRQWLEDALYVRPRTKEFLIGFPFFILALYVMSIKRVWGYILLVPGVIGFLSIVNTFTHLHISLNVSILRTTYSIVLGFIVGLVFIAIFKAGYYMVNKFISRWS